VEISTSGDIDLTDYVKREEVDEIVSSTIEKIFLETSW
jgi:hypothetical protein